MEIRQFVETNISLLFYPLRCFTFWFWKNFRHFSADNWVDSSFQGMISPSATPWVELDGDYITNWFCLTIWDLRPQVASLTLCQGISWKKHEAVDAGAILRQSHIPSISLVNANSMQTNPAIVFRCFRKSSVNLGARRIFQCWTKP